MQPSSSWPGAWPAFSELLTGNCLIAVNKVDLRATSLGGGPGGVPVYGVSVKTGAGMGELLGAIGATAATSLQSGAMPVITRARHREALCACADALAAFEARTDRLGYPEIAGEDLRSQPPWRASQAGSMSKIYWTLYFEISALANNLRTLFHVKHPQAG